MKKNIVLLLFLLTSVIFSHNIVINEVVSSNNGSFYDKDGDTPDWIELYNATDAAVNLNGYYLSDDTSDVTKWQFGEAILEAKQYLIICASDKDTLDTYWHTNFKISGSGEYVVLSNSTGMLVDSVFVHESIDNYSFGRKADGNSEWIYQEPTPGKSNTGIPIEEYADEITFSNIGGFYSSEVNVELSAGESEIYYTLDGSNPDKTSQLYTLPIKISKTSVLKALSKKKGYLDTEITYNTYFINETTDLPVVSLSTNPGNLFDADTGIYVNYEEDWERPAHIELYDDNKQLGFSENVGINIYGAFSRCLPQKSLAVKFKSKYGKNKLEYELFPGFWLKKFKSFLLRNSGNDFEQTHIRDGFMHTLIKDLDIDYLEYRPAVAYINGEYWGIYNIREKISEHYIANRHGVDPDNIDMLGGYSAYKEDYDGNYGIWEGNLEVVHGDTVSYKELIDYMKNEDLKTDAAYTYLDSVIDLNECLLYYAVQIYYNNEDWPHNNSKFWREKSSNGKWRWILYDLDFGFNFCEFDFEGNDCENSDNDLVPYIFYGIPPVKPAVTSFIPRKLVQNPKIKTMFVNQVADLLNTTFQPDRVLNILHDVADHISGDIARHRQRFGLSDTKLKRMESFANKRPENFRNHVRNFFEAGDDYQIDLNIEGGGTIKISTLSLDSNEMPWSGVYYQNNTVEIKAVAKQGYKFNGWTGTITSDEPNLKINNLSSVELKANFVVDNSTTSDIVINEINYNSANDFDSGDWVELYNRSENNIDIGNWYFSDSDINHKFIIPEGTVLESDSYLVLVEDSLLFSTSFSEVKNYLGKTGFGLSGSGELIRLINSNNEVVDSLTYSDDEPWPTTPDGKGPTLELINSAADNSVAEFWRASEGHGTPGAENSVITDIEDNTNSELPTQFGLYQNYPNPFNPSTTITYKLPHSTRVQLRVYDLLGRDVMTLVNLAQPAGSYSVELNANRLATGMYIYTLQTDKFIQSKKMILLK